MLEWERLLKGWIEGFYQMVNSSSTFGAQNYWIFVELWVNLWSKKTLSSADFLFFSKPLFIILFSCRSFLILCFPFEGLIVYVSNHCSLLFAFIELSIFSVFVSQRQVLYTNLLLTDATLMFYNSQGILQFKR